MLHGESPPSLNPYLFSHRKRFIDVTIGGILAGLSYPAEVLTAGALRHSLDEGPIYLHQERLGIVVTKLRTMLVVPPEETYQTMRMSSDLSDKRVPQGFPEYARRFRLDEIPQLRQSVIGGLRGGVPRMSLVGLRPLLEQHANEFYEETKAVDPELAYRWRYTWYPTAPRGVFSPAACHYIDRTSNHTLNIIDWVAREDEYCRTGNELVDIKHIADGLSKISRGIGRQLVGIAHPQKYRTNEQ